MKTFVINRKTFALLLCLPLCAWGADTALRSSNSGGASFTVDATTWHGDKAIRIPLVFHSGEWKKAGFAGNAKQASPDAATTENAWLYVTATAYQLQDVNGRALMGGPRGDLQLDKAHCIKMRTLAVSVCGSVVTGATGYDGSAREGHDFLREVTRDFPAAYQEVVAHSSGAPASNLVAEATIAPAPEAAPAPAPKPVPSVVSSMASSATPGPVVTAVAACPAPAPTVVAATAPAPAPTPAPTPAPEPVAAAPAPVVIATSAPEPVATPASVVAAPVVAAPAPVAPGPVVIAKPEPVVAAAPAPAPIDPPASPAAPVEAPQPKTVVVAAAAPVFSEAVTPKSLAAAAPAPSGTMQPVVKTAVPRVDPTVALKLIASRDPREPLQVVASIEPVAALRQQERPTVAWRTPRFMIRRVAAAPKYSVPARPRTAVAVSAPPQPIASPKPTPLTPAVAPVTAPVFASAQPVASSPQPSRAVFSTPVKELVEADSHSQGPRTVSGFDVVTTEASSAGAKRGLPMVSDDLTPVGAPRGVVAEAPDPEEVAAKAADVSPAKRESINATSALPSKPATSATMSTGTPAQQALAKARAERRAEIELARSRKLSVLPESSEVKAVPLDKPVQGYHPHMATSTVFTELRVPGDKLGTHSKTATPAATDKFSSETPTESAAEVKVKRPVAKAGAFPAVVTPSK